MNIITTSIDSSIHIFIHSFIHILLFLWLGRLEQERHITPSNELPTDHSTKIDTYKAEIITLEKKLAEEQQKASLAMFKNVQVFNVEICRCLYSILTELETYVNDICNCYLTVIF